MAGLQRVGVFVCAAVLFVGCGGTPESAPTTPPAAPDEPTASAAEEPAESTCGELSGDAEGAFAEARAFDEAPQGSDEYDVLNKRIALYRKAAVAGHLEGQAIAGPLIFTTLFGTEAPVPEEREVYVEALGYIFIAALRGHSGALSFSEDVAPIVESRAIPAELQMPFSDLDRAWLEQALADSLAWMDCHGGAGAP